MVNSQLSIVIVGVGAMGTLFAGRIAPYVEVAMLGHWPEALAALRTDGVQVVGSDGQMTTAQVRVYDDAAHVPPADFALILVKSHQTAAAAEAVAQFLQPAGIALTLQNGLGNDEILRQKLGDERVAVGVTSQGARLLRPGVVQDTGAGPVTVTKGHEVVERFVVEVLQPAGFDTHLTDNPAQLIWEKLVVNAVINPVTALLQVPNGFLAEHSMAHELVQLITGEVVAVAQAVGVTVSDPIERVMQVARATAVNRSSMSQDLATGRLTEIEAINGAIAQLGKQYHVKIPANDLLTYLIQLAQNGHNWQQMMSTRAMSSGPAAACLYYLFMLERIRDHAHDAKAIAQIEAEHQFIRQKHWLG